MHKDLPGSGDRTAAALGADSLGLHLRIPLFGLHLRIPPSDSMVQIPRFGLHLWAQPSDFPQTKWFGQGCSSPRTEMVRPKVLLTFGQKRKDRKVQTETPSDAT